MALRTPNTLTNPQTLLDLQRTKERISVVQDQLSSGRRIVHLADDPSGSALILDFQTSIDRNTQYLRQGDAAGSFLQASETALTSVSDDLMRLMELGAEGAFSTLSASARASLATEVDGLRSALISTANTQFEGKFIFSGTATLTQPFSGPAAGPIAYAGDAGTVNLEVSPTYTVGTNLVGSSVFFGAGGQASATDVFQAATDLRDALLTNNTALLQTANTNLQNIHNSILQNITDLGGRQAALGHLKDTLGDMNLSLQSVLSSAQDLDYPTAISEFTNLDTARQAALSTLAKVNRQNLFDFLA